MNIIILAFGSFNFFAWFASLIYCISNAEWLAVIVLHVLIAPIGVVHGYFVLFGEGWF